MNDLLHSVLDVMLRCHHVTRNGETPASVPARGDVTNLIHTRLITQSLNSIVK